MADAWSSSTSYHSGRRDGDGDEGVTAGAPARARSAESAYAPRANPRPHRSAYEASATPRAASDAPYLTRSQSRRQIRQRGLAGWAALLVMVAIAGVGGVIDLISGTSIRGGFDIALVIASIASIVLVRHRDMFPIVVAPPILYVLAYGAVLYVRSGGLHNRKILTDSAANLLVYGFPAIAGASAAVLIIAGIRMVFGK